MFDAPNSNTLWARLLVEELVRSGVRFFCLAPGSRSTPLVTAVAANPGARHLVHFDERATAFCALGYARATGRPAAWVTTSGTAAANGLPAVVEAATDAVPLVLLTADRPPELRQTGANQTIDQVKLFGDYVRWQFDLPAPEASVDPAMVLTTVDQAVAQALRAPAGPVHLNCMFREPLAPVPATRSPGAGLDALHAWQAGGAPYTQYVQAHPCVAPADLEAVWKVLGRVERGLLVAGRLDAPGAAASVRRLAAVLGWPLLPDVTSQLRLGRHEGAEVVPFYDLVLAAESFRGRNAPQAVLHLGGRVTSKRLLQYLEGARPVPYVVVNPDPRRLDPSHRVTLRLEADVANFCSQLVALAEGGPQGRASDAWRVAWRNASAQTAVLLDAALDGAESLSEPLVARLVARHVPEDHGVFLASSMPVRDMDMFSIPGGAAPRVAANRGASGIDGIVATAAGFSFGLERPVTLLIGDLAFLYDLNALAMLRRLPHPVVLVVVNNDGGGIFSFLPIARFQDVFEPFFATPHGLSFEAAAELFGLAYARPETPAAFVEVYRAACRRPTATLIEVRTDRQANYTLHQHVLQQVAGELS